ncbi:hypothetical protein SK128_012038, partial [Halocaridina rubra]
MTDLLRRSLMGEAERFDDKRTSTRYFPVTLSIGSFPTKAFKSPMNTTFAFIPKSCTHLFNFIKNSSLFSS